MRGGHNKLTNKEVIARFNDKHGNKYDYSKVEYIDRGTPVCIICPIHGEFYMSPKNHWKGCNCQECSKEIAHDALRMTFADFSKRATLVHNGKYRYIPIILKNNRQKVQIECPKHGIFKQSVDGHLSGKGCPICKGEKNRTLIYGVGVMDVFGNENFLKELWRGMLKRCYNKKSPHSGYEDCNVCDEWHTYSNFKKWFENNKEEYKKGYQIDKDILIPFNTTYSPDTCCFVPKRINSLLIGLRNNKGKYKIGVSKRNGMYFAQLVKSEPREHIWLGTYTTEEEAHQAYVKAKEKYIKEVATNYFSRGEISERVYKALMNYKID